MKQEQEMPRTKRPRRARGETHSAAQRTHKQAADHRPSLSNETESSIENLRVRYPQASAEALSFIARANANRHYRAAMRDLADR
jgi:hypothetical protein